MFPPPSSPQWDMGRRHILRYIFAMLPLAQNTAQAKLARRTKTLAALQGSRHDKRETGLCCVSPYKKTPPV